MYGSLCINNFLITKEFTIVWKTLVIFLANLWNFDFAVGNLQDRPQLNLSIAA